MPLSEIQSLDVVTEDNRASIAGKVGWGVAGAVVLGPVGMLAGVLGGGIRKVRIISVLFADGRKVLLKGTADDLELLVAANFGGSTGRQAKPPDEGRYNFPPEQAAAQQPPARDYFWVWFIVGNCVVIAGANLLIYRDGFPSGPGISSFLVLFCLINLMILLGYRKL